jgi:acyl carrier protein phosphodiesterase
VNFLAHFQLGWPDEGLVAGGLEGDFYKGILRGELPPALERGVVLHRAIDAFTDGHPLIVRLRRELPPDLRRYAGILIDLCFDHYLSVHWSQFSSVHLPEFSAAVYRILEKHEGSLTDPARTMAARIIEHDVLNLYSQWDTVPASAARIGQRFKRHNPFLTLDADLSPVKAEMEQTFLSFYPQLQSFSREKISGI